MKQHIGDNIERKPSVSSHPRDGWMPIVTLERFLVPTIGQSYRAEYLYDKPIVLQDWVGRGNQTCYAC